MLKTIKTTKQMRLDELLKYVWGNSVNEKRVFLGNHEQRVVFDNVGGFYPSGYVYSPDTTFTVEIEEPITEDTVFDNLIEVTKNDNVLHYNRTNISDVATNRSSKRFYALISGKLELVWERDEECI